MITFDLNCSSLGQGTNQHILAYLFLYHIYAVRFYASESERKKKRKKVCFVFVDISLAVCFDTFL